MTNEEKNAVLSIVNTLFDVSEASHVYKTAMQFNTGKEAAKYVVGARVSLNKLKSLRENVSDDFYSYISVIKEYQSWKYPLLEWDFETAYALAIKWIGDVQGLRELSEELQNEMKQKNIR